MTVRAPFPPPSSPETYTVPIGDDKAGARLDRTLASALPQFSRSRLKAMIESGLVSEATTGAARDPARAVRAGERFVVAPPPPAPLEPPPQAIDLVVAYEDEELIVIDKPAGLIVHPGAGAPDRTLVNALLAHCGGRLSPVGAPARPGIVHRLDKDTSGLIVAAKTEAAHHGLARQFAEHTVERAYLAVVSGHPRQPEGRIDGLIARSTADRTRMAVTFGRGKRAVTNYRVVRALGSAAALLECRLATGRTHQIRVHMASIGCPVVGDPTYRSRFPTPAPVRDAIVASGLARQALHAYLIGFVHPATLRPLRIESNIPKDIKALLNFLEGV